jgi:Flp pilus assembly protein TadG
MCAELKRVLNRGRLFAQSESGITVVALALILPLLIAFTGIAIDLGRVQMVQSKLQFSVDSAGLAAGAKLATADPSIEFKKYLDANFNGYMDSVITNYSLQTNEKGTVFTLTATATVPTTFMGFVGVQNSTVSASSEISRAVSGLELVLALDNTGSMSEYAGGYVTKLSALKTAAKTLVTTLFAGVDPSEKSTLWVGIVPFSQAVNIGTGHPEWINPDYVYDNARDSTVTSMVTTDGLDWGPNNNWAGCVDSRLHGYDTREDPPSSGNADTLYGKYYWTSDNLNYPRSFSIGQNNLWHFKYTQVQYKFKRCMGTSCTNSWWGGWSTCQAGGYTCTKKAEQTEFLDACDTYYESCTLNYPYASPLGRSLGPNRYCPQEVTAMTDVPATLTGAIDAMQATGNTQISDGLAWAWNMLSPRWRGKWGGTMDSNDLPLDYNPYAVNKAVVLLTDGNNTLSNGSHGSYWFSSSGRLNGQTLDQKVQALCTGMKAQNIRIYTIALGQKNSNGSYNYNATLLRNCASAESFYFEVPTTSELQNSFNQIGDSLSNLRVSH